MTAAEAIKQNIDIEEFRKGEKQRYAFERERFMTTELLLDFINTYLAVVDTRRKLTIVSDSAISAFAKDIKKLNQLEANLWKNISNSMQVVEEIKQ